MGKQIEGYLGSMERGLGDFGRQARNSSGRSTLIVHLKNERLRFREEAKRETGTGASLNGHAIPQPVIFV